MKVHLAGFDVFRPDADNVFELLCSEARRFGLTPMTPLDGEQLFVGCGPSGSCSPVFRSNIERLASADAVIAHLAPFRGVEPDSGTVFEVGYAIARGIPVVGCGVPAATYAERVGADTSCIRCDAGLLRERSSGMLVEEFGLRLNLMLACSIDLHSAAAEALGALAAILRTRAIHREGT